jgi:hypothetical protein
MTQVNKRDWLKRNPNIKFKHTKKLLFGKYLYSVSLRMPGVTFMYSYEYSPKITHPKYPTYEQYTQFLLTRCLSRMVDRTTGLTIAETQSELDKYLVEDRYIAIPSTHAWMYSDHADVGFRQLIDTVALHKAYMMIKTNTPESGIRCTKMYDHLYIYANDIDKLAGAIQDLEIDDNDILTLSYPSPSELAVLTAGKEVNTKAEKFKYKVIFKPIPDVGLPALHKYLTAIQKEDASILEMPGHFISAIVGKRSSRQFRRMYNSKSYMYVNDLGLILIINLMAEGRYSAYRELVMPERNSE